MEHGKRNATAAVVLAAAILVSLGAICVRGVTASQIDTVIELKRSLP